MGLRKVLVTHAEFPSQNLTADEQLELADMGAVIEHCFTTMHTGKAPWEEVLDSIRVVGPERCLLSTDLGQTINPPVSEGFAMFAQTLLDAGFSVEEVRRMAVTNPRGYVAGIIRHGGSTRLFWWSARTRPISCGEPAERSRSTPSRGYRVRILCLSFGERGESQGGYGSSPA